MTWKYETRSLSEIYRLMAEDEHIHPDFEELQVIANKAYKVAKVFEEKGMCDELIIKYLNNELECDALCELGLTTSVLYPSDVSVEDRIYSYSHNQWMNSLHRTKLQWTWKETNINLEDTQSNKLQRLLNSYKELQQLALSYDYE
jgi:hypothetical protein